VIPTRPWRDVDELSLLEHVNPVPFSSRHNACFARAQFDACARIGLCSYPKTSGNHIEYLVPIRVDFASVRCVFRNRDDPHCHAIDSQRRTGPMRPCGYGKITMDVKQGARDIDWGNPIWQTILLSMRDKQSDATCYCELDSAAPDERITSSMS